MLLREWLSDRRRRSAVAKRSPTSDPPEVAHALDYFIWLALDERQFVSGPQNLRVPSDDERYYNDILNHYFGTDDQDPTAWFVKEGYIVHRFTHRLGADEARGARHSPATRSACPQRRRARQSRRVPRLLHEAAR